MVAEQGNPRSQVIKVRRSEVKPGDVILGPARADRSLVPRRSRPHYLRRTSSLDGDDFRQADPRGRRDLIKSSDPRDMFNPLFDPLYDQQYDSEGSVPARSRRPNRRRGGRERNRYDEDDTSSSASSSDLGCTDDDEKSKKKAKLKKWGTIGLAGVATIHAVSGVHSTIEKHKKRQEELEDGEISEEEADRRRNMARWKNAANIGIAAIWIKGAVDEFKEYREAAKEHQEACAKSEERHRLRIERRKAIQRGEYQGTHKMTPEERRHYLKEVEENSERRR